MPRESDSRRDSQGGFALVLAVFVISVLAALGVYMLAMSADQHATAAMSVQEARALDAARAGIEWSTARAISTHACANGSFSPGASTLSGFIVNVTCTASSHTVQGQARNTYVIDAVASSGTYGSADYVSRHLQSVADGPGS